jgi:hypothetical protein
MFTPKGDNSANGHPAISICATARSSLPRRIKAARITDRFRILPDRSVFFERRRVLGGCPMKTIFKFFTAVFLAAAIVLCIAPHWDNRLQSSLYPKPYSKTVRQAIVKSYHWADDRDILNLVSKAEQKYGSQINQISKKYYANPQDIKAIAIVESLMDETAKSSEGAIGLMGIKRTTGMEMGFTDIEHPIKNLNAGTKYYKTLLKKFKDRELAFAAYNLGPGKVENRLSSGFDPETVDYIWKIRRVVHIITKSESQHRFN